MTDTPGGHVKASDHGPATAAVFLVLRRMRAPLVVLVAIFTITGLGLSLIPGTDSDGNPWRMGLFDAFYFMSYTATTIGYGEIPHAFNEAQRMWVTFSIYLTVVGWAYAIATLTALTRDRGLRRAIATQRFRRRVSRIREPFWIMAGHGQTGELLGQWLDAFERNFVAIDIRETRIDVLDLGSYSSVVAGLTADARDIGVLVDAGLTSPYCAGVLGLTDDEEANLAITMNVAVLRPELPVIVRAASPTIIHRMRQFGQPTIINAFDRFGDHFRVALRAPATDQLALWLNSAPGTPLPERQAEVPQGSWIVCTYGRFGQELVADLRADGHRVTVIENNPDLVTDGVILGDATEPGMLRSIAIADAVGFVAGTDNDITNLSLIAAARRLNPGMFVVARLNNQANEELFAALRVDLLMFAPDIIAQEALAHIGAPLLLAYLHDLAQQPNGWSAAVLDDLISRCGQGSPDLWQVELTPHDAPAVVRVMAGLPELPLGNLLRDPQDRNRPVGVMVLMVEHDGVCTLHPPEDFPLRIGDRLLLAGTPVMRHAMETTLSMDSAATYALTGQAVASGWAWRVLTQRRARPGR